MAGLFFIAGLLCKETTLIFPFFLLLYRISFPENFAQAKGKRRFSTVLLTLVIIAGIYALLRMTVLHFAPQMKTWLTETNLYFRFLTACRVIAIYFGLLAAPHGLHMERYIPLSTTIFEPKSFFAFFFVLGLAFYPLGLEKEPANLFWHDLVSLGAFSDAESALSD